MEELNTERKIFKLFLLLNALMDVPYPRQYCAAVMTYTPRRILCNMFTFFTRRFGL